MKYLALIGVLAVTVVVAAQAGTTEAVSEGEVTINVSRVDASEWGEVTLVVNGVRLPGRVLDLTIDSTTSSAVFLSWTAVDDGMGNPANYAVRVGTPTISWDDAENSQLLIYEAPPPGEKVFVTFGNLQSDTRYEFQLAAFREN